MAKRLKSWWLHLCNHFVYKIIQFQLFKWPDNEVFFMRDSIRAIFRSGYTNLQIPAIRLAERLKSRCLSYVQSLCPWTNPISASRMAIIWQSTRQNKPTRQTPHYRTIDHPKTNRTSDIEPARFAYVTAQSATIRLFSDTHTRYPDGDTHRDPRHPVNSNDPSIHYRVQFRVWSWRYQHSGPRLSFAPRDVRKHYHYLA